MRRIFYRWQAIDRKKEEEEAADDSMEPAEKKKVGRPKIPKPSYDFPGTSRAQRKGNRSHTNLYTFFLENIDSPLPVDLISGPDYEVHCAELVKQSKLPDFDVDGVSILMKMTFPNRNAAIVAGTVGPVTYYLDQFCPFLKHRQFVSNNLFLFFKQISYLK